MITLKNEEIELILLPLGATIYQLKTKNKFGEFRNIALTHRDLETYENGNPSYFGATCGRFAGRIANGTFEIDGIKYNFPKNYRDKHTLHGGYNGFNGVVWDYEIIEEKEKSICVFTHTSEDLEEGFPGTLELKVEYVVEKNTVTINYYAISDKKTYLNMTNHNYFSLTDDEKNIYNHILQLDSKKYITCDEDVIPTGTMDVVGTEFDFTKPIKLGDLSNKKDKILQEFGGYDNAFALDKSDLGFDLYLKDEKSGRSMKIVSTYPSVVLYTYNEPNTTELLDRENVKHCGIAIEPQYAPNAPNDDRFFIPIVDENNPYKESIKYIFNE